MTSSLKFVVLLAVAIAAVIVSGEDVAENQIASPFSSNDLTLGKREKGDKIVAKVTVKAGASLVGKKVIREKTIEAPNQEITYVKALDRAKKNGASVEVTGGGIGTDSVTLRFKSQRFHGIDFEVQVFAKASDDD